jgi:hypothetical protein
VRVDEAVDSYTFQTNSKMQLPFEGKTTLTNDTLFLLLRSKSWIFKVTDITVVQSASLDKSHEEPEHVDSDIIQVDKINIGIALVLCYVKFQMTGEGLTLRGLVFRSRSSIATVVTGIHYFVAS